MPSNGLFRRILLRAFRNSPTAPIQRKAKSFAGLLERLEDRTVPAALDQTTYVIGATGSFPGGYWPDLSGPPPFSPSQLDKAYGINLITDGGIQQQGAGQTVAIVDAYDDPNMVSSSSSSFSTSDLHAFDQQFGLPEPTGFFTKVNQTGGTSYPSGNSGWGLEISLDVEWVHSVAPLAKIVLVEGSAASNVDLLNAAAKWAGKSSGASVVTMSFGIDGGFSGENSYDGDFTSSGVTYFASTGDASSPAGYPAESPDVVAVGGTTLSVNGSGNYSSESVWGNGSAGSEGGGGGISKYENAPTFQSGLVIHSGSTIISQNGKRATPDVSSDADPGSGVWVYDTYGESGWLQIGGTSLSSPTMAAEMAITNEIRANHGLNALTGNTQTLPKLYSIYNSASEYSANFHDVTTGSNGYYAATGYDLGTGIGTPVSNSLIPTLALLSSIGVTSSSANLAANASTLTIVGSGFDANPAYDTVTFNDGAVGTITAATTTSLTVSLTTDPTSVGSLTATVTADGFSSGAPVQVATVTPVVLPNASTIPANAATISISGFAFDPTKANDSIAFSDGAVGTVTAATSTSLSVAFTTDPTSAGVLSATVTVDGISSGSAVEVATVDPVVAQTTTGISSSSPTVTISGFGFATSNANNSVAFNLGAAGTVTSSSPTQLVVAFSSEPSTSGSLTAVVTSNSFSSGTPVQVATVENISITQNTSPLAEDATQVAIGGSGFSSTVADDSVVFNDGAVGTVVAATGTQLTVNFTTSPTSTGPLNATVAVSGSGSAGPTQVATVVAPPTVTPNAASIPFNSTAIVISGSGFSPTIADNSIAFNNGAVGIIAAASGTALTVSFSTPPTALGSLTAVVTSNGGSSGAPVQVATVVPVVSPSSASIGANAATLTIAGLGFDPTIAHDSVAFNDGAIGSVTAATPTSLTVSFGTYPITAGTLTASVVVDGVSSGTPVSVATVDPVVTANSADLPATSSSISIVGFGFDPTLANDSVAFNDGAIGTVTAATPTTLTVTFSTEPTTAGSLTATVIVGGISSGSAVQVATIAPVVTGNSSNLPANSAAITIAGYGFDPTLANDSIAFDDGAIGTVTAATATSLTVAFSTEPLTAGALTASVVVDGVSSGSAVQVATIAPVVTPNSPSLPANATTLSISGFGFDPTLANDAISFNDGAVGTVTAATATSLTISFSMEPTTAGSLTAIATIDGIASGSPVQVATIAPVVTASSANLAANASSMTISGFGFDPTLANDSVTLNDGAIGTISAASPTSLTIAFSSTPVTAGVLTAAVTVDGIASGSAVPVATVTPVVSSGTLTVPANASTISLAGFGFDAIAGHDAVSFNDGAIGTVTLATPTVLTVTFSTDPTTAGILTASVTVDGIASGSPQQVATVAPVVTVNSGKLSANSSTIAIAGFGFDPVAANDSIAFNDGAVGTVAAATATFLTVAFTTAPTTAGSLTAVVTVDGISSGSPTIVSTVAPVVTSSSANLTANASAISIAGFGFDPEAANDSIAFNDGAVGTVTAATATSLSVSFSTDPTTAGILTATVLVDGVSSGTPASVATIAPVVSFNSANLPATASGIAIAGFGFDPTAANDAITFNDGAIGRVIAATPTSLTVSFSTDPTTAGILTASVVVDGVSSGTPIEVAAIGPVVAPNAATLAANAATISIAGFGFDPVKGNDSISFNDGAVGTVTSATATTLTIAFATDPIQAGTLTAIVTADGESSGIPVQVATVVPVAASNTGTVPANTANLTIAGFGFDPIAADDAVSFSDGAVGSVTSATATSLAIAFSTDPITAGSLTATITADGESSGVPVQVATVAPVVSFSPANLPANAASVTIAGFGFDPTAANDVATFSDGAVGTAIAATPTSLTIAFSTDPITAGSLSASIATDGISSGTPVQIATAIPVVTQNPTIVPANAATLTISGYGFDPNEANDTVAFNDGAVGSMTAATATTLTVAFSTKPTTAGILTASVATDGESSGVPVEVAAVAPVVATSAATLAANASSITIAGFGFDPTLANDAISFNDGAVGTVTAATATSLTISFSRGPATAGSLTASAVVDSESSGMAVRVATIAPVVSLNATNIPATAPSFTISGFGFDPNKANDTASFNDGAVGTVTAATTTSLTISFTTEPTTAGILTASVTTDGISSGSPLEVAAVAPVVSQSAASLAANATAITISGFGFDPNKANDSIAFNDGAIGTVTAATPTSLTLSLSSDPTSAGVLTAVATVDGIASGSAVQVGTVVPVITANTQIIANDPTITVAGFGFDPNKANDSVAFNDGAVGTITLATARQLTIAFSTLPVAAGKLTAVATVDGVSNSVPVQVATIEVITLSSLPNWTMDHPYTPTITTSGGTGLFSFSLQSGTLPTGLTLNSAGGFIGSPTAAGTFTFTVLATQSATISGTKTYALTINPTIVVGPATLPNWTVNVSGYNQTIVATGGTGADTFSVTSGRLPTGLTLNSTAGVIAGTPKAVGTYQFTIAATDSVGAAGSQSYTVAIDSAMSIANPTATQWTNEYPGFTGTMAITGGTPSYSIVGTPTNLPPGLTALVNGSTISFSGTPTAAGTYNSTIVIQDASGSQVAKSFTLTINPQIAFSLATLPPYVVGQQYSETVKTFGGTGTVAVHVQLSGSLPTGLTLTVHGSYFTITGKPLTTTHVTIEVEAIDAIGAESTIAYNLT